jgi:hypothetical protein
VSEHQYVANQWEMLRANFEQESWSALRERDLGLGSHWKRDKDVHILSESEVGVSSGWEKDTVHTERGKHGSKNQQTRFLIEPEGLTPND